LIASGLVRLADLARHDLVDFGDLDQQLLNLHELASDFAIEV